MCACAYLIGELATLELLIGHQGLEFIQVQQMLCDHLSGLIEAALQGFDPIQLHR